MLIQSSLSVPGIMRSLGGTYRQEIARQFNGVVYPRRQVAENKFPVLKRKSGEALKVRIYRLRIKEIKINVILYNLSRMITTLSFLVLIEEFYRADFMTIYIGRVPAWVQLLPFVKRNDSACRYGQGVCSRTVLRVQAPRGRASAGNYPGRSRVTGGATAPAAHAPCASAILTGSGQRSCYCRTDLRETLSRRDFSPQYERQRNCRSRHFRPVMAGPP